METNRNNPFGKRTSMTDEELLNLISKKRRAGSLFFAVLLISIGTVVLVRSLHVVPEPFVFLLSWRTVLIAVGVYLICARKYLAGILMTSFCTYSLLNEICAWLLPMPSGRIIFSVVLIAFGVFLITHQHDRSRHLRRWHHEFARIREGVAAPDDKEPDATDGVLRCNVRFASEKQVVLDEVFRGAELRIRCGGIVLDLRNTTLEEGETYIEVDVTLSGIELFVPADWYVVACCNQFMGGIEDKRQRYASSMPNRERRLVLRGDMTMSGIAIKS